MATHRSERDVASFGKGRGSMNQACFDAANGDPLVALDLAVDLVVKFHGPTVERRMAQIRHERRRAA